MVRPLISGCLIASFAMIGNHANAQSGAEVMKKLMKTYQGLQSYQSAANADQIIALAKDNRTITQDASSVQFDFKKQNKLKLNFTTSKGGKLVYCDGAKITSYDSGALRYSIYPTGSSMKETRDTLGNKLKISSVFDPLFFLSGVPLPGNLVNFALKKTETMNGRKTLVLTGELRTASQTITLKNGKKSVNPASTAFWTWWIDEGTYLLSKLEMRVNNIPQVVVMADKKDKNKKIYRQITTNLIVRQSISGVKPNPSIDDKLFVFTPPAGSIEVKTTEDTIKL